MGPGERGKQMGNATTTAAVEKRRPRQTGRAGQGDRESQDIHPELARLLEGRWEEREEPFQGFDSPEGKF